MSAKNNHTILALPSWYPNKTAPFEGDFIQRHIHAIGLQKQQYVIYVVKDKDGNITNDVTIEKTESDNVTELICYYRSFKTGIGIADKLISHAKYLSIYKKLITAFIKENGLPVLVHVHVALKAGILAKWLKKKFHLPYLVTEHWSGYFPGSDLNIYEANRVLRNSNKTILQQAAVMVPVTKNLGDTICSFFVPVNYTVIPNVVNTALFYYKPFTPPKFRFIHPSGMDEMKNPAGILKACKLVKEKGYHFELLMLGKTDKSLITAAADLAIGDCVSFSAAVPYEEVAVQMQQSSALVLFSWFESLPCVLLEALCCGLPVISTNVGGISEVIDSTNGSLVEAGNIEQLAVAMCELIDNNTQYNRKDIAFKATEKFNYTTVGKQYVALYEKYSKSIV